MKESGKLCLVLGQLLDALRFDKVDAGAKAGDARGIKGARFITVRPSQSILLFFGVTAGTSLAY